MQDRSIIEEIERAFASGSAEKQSEIVRRVTDLFLANADKYSDEQIDLFDGVIASLAERIEVRARAELSRRLAQVENAPSGAVGKLARDSAIEVAAPMLQFSKKLTDDDLLEIASSRNQERMLAISKRETVSERVSDVLVAHGNRDVVLSVTRNEGARFSDSGYGKLVERSIDDEVLAVCVSMRKDIPREHFETLITKASEVVFERLAASNPEALYELHHVLIDITGRHAGTRAIGRDYRNAAAQFDVARRSGRPVDDIVREFAENGRFEETVAALAALCRLPIKLVENVMNDARPESDLVLILTKAAGLSWPAAKQVCILRRKAIRYSPQLMETARGNFERLQTRTAQRLVRFYNERYAAFSDFQQLAQKIRLRDGGGQGVAGAA
ncbi:MAG: DUF2336 domain-containing protein [Pseudolabrys sp.]|nr:DUF2336 domain-containing protein [Pseudolabrys sp.]